MNYEKNNTSLPLTQEEYIEFTTLRSMSKCVDISDEDYAKLIKYEKKLVSGLKEIRGEIYE